MTQEQLSKLDNFYIPYSLDDEVEELLIDARSLLCGQRFDIYAILLYVEHKVRGVQDMSYAIKIYKERTRAITGHSFNEVGNADKNTFQCYLDTLDNLIRAFQSGEYDYEKTLIPIDRNGILMDGAHRASCAAYFGKQIKVLKFLKYDTMLIDQEYLCTKNFMPERISEAMAMEASRWHDDLHLIFLWPKANLYAEKKKASLDYLRDTTEVIYERDLKLSYEGVRNLMIQLYGHMDWTGGYANGYPNIYGKVDEVWDSNGVTRAVLARVPSVDNMQSIKEHVRDIFGIGLASIHSTDDTQEMLIAVNSLFNPNSRHFLLNGHPTRFLKSYALFEKFRDLLNKTTDADNYLIESSMILALYGIREARDLDYLTLSDSPIATDDEDMEDHRDALHFHTKSLSDIIVSPQNYFSFYGIKFLTPENLLNYKNKRNEAYKMTNDIKDIKDIKHLLFNEGKTARELMFDAKVLFIIRYRRFKENFPIWRRRLLERLHIYDFSRATYHRIFK